MKCLIFTVMINILFACGISQDYWELLPIPDTIEVKSVDLDSNNVVYVGMSLATGGGILKSFGVGYNWVPSGLQNIGIYLIEITENNLIYAGASCIYRSANLGEDWEVISPEINPISLYVSNNNDLFVGKWGGIFKSGDNGNTWVQVLTLNNWEVVNEIIEDYYNSLYAAVTNYMGGEGIYRSTDGGDSWPTFGLTNSYVSSLSINTQGDIFAGTRGHYYNYSGGVYLLPFGQTNWININNDELVTSIEINQEDEIFIGCSNLDGHYGGVRASFDNGITWEPIITGIGNKDVEDLQMGPDGYLYAITDESTHNIYKSVSSTITMIDHNLIMSPIIYPNPFTIYTAIYYQNSNNENELVEIYDLNGIKIKEFEFINVYNPNSLILNFEGFASGIYVCKISFNKKIFINKLVLK